MSHVGCWTHCSKPQICTLWSALKLLKCSRPRRRNQGKNTETSTPLFILKSHWIRHTATTSFRIIISWRRQHLVKQSDIVHATLCWVENNRPVTYKGKQICVETLKSAAAWMWVKSQHFTELTSAAQLSHFSAFMSFKPVASQLQTSLYPSVPSRGLVFVTPSTFLCAAAYFCHSL